VTLATAPIVITGTSGETTKHFYTKKKSVVIIVENKTRVSKFIGNINGKEYVFDLPFLGKTHEIDISQYIKSGRNTLILRLSPDESSKKTLKVYVKLFD
jgi:hypothetical protein